VDSEERPKATEAGVGLCSICAHGLRVVSSRRSHFWRCQRAASDPTFAKYPHLPVFECRGYEAGGITDR